MTSIILLICTTGIYHPTPLVHEHCVFYNVSVNVPDVRIPVDEFCKQAGELAIKHGGKLTKCELVLPARKPDDRRPGSIRT